MSYDAQIANERRGEPAIPPMWYLMNEGKRRPVLLHVPGSGADGARWRAPPLGGRAGLRRRRPIPFPPTPEVTPAEP